MVLLEKEILSSILFYHDNRTKLMQAYSGRYLLIQKEVVLGDFSSWSEACLHGYKILQHDQFFIRYCQ